MKILGALLLAAGILIAGASGLCSLVLLAEPGSLNSDTLAIVGIVGGIPFLVGVGVAFAGYVVIRSAEPRE